MLLALLYALTQHARYHEITAIRAAGVTLWRLALPYLAVGFLASLTLFYLNEQWAPDADDRAELFLDGKSVMVSKASSSPERKRVAIGAGKHVLNVRAENNEGGGRNPAGLIVLVPGLPLTTALTELATRHLAAGPARLSGALVLFLSIGFGTAQDNTWPT